MVEVGRWDVGETRNETRRFQTREVRDGTEETFSFQRCRLSLLVVKEEGRREESVGERSDGRGGESKMTGKDEP